MKKSYLQPTTKVVMLQYQQQLLLTGSLSDVSSNLLSEEELILIDTPQDTWGR